jgi:DUF1009 family protein
VKYDKLALLAGGGELPLVFLKRAAASGQEVLVFEIRGEGNPGLRKFNNRVVTVDPVNIEQLMKTTSAEGIKHIMFLGYVRPASLLKNFRFDARTVKAFISLKDKSTKSLMKSVMAEFEKEGAKAIPTTYLMDDVLAKEGFYTSAKTGIKALKNVIDIARKLAGLEIGQTIVAGSGMIWAVEAMEGTDNCIRRGGKLAKKGFTVIKMARPNQDFRYDVPVAGLRTVKLIKSLGGNGLVVEAGRTFLLDKDAMIKFADKHNLFVYGWRNKK